MVAITYGSAHPVYNRNLMTVANRWKQTPKFCVVHPVDYPGI